ncbi:MAG: hypothetical protein KDE54_33480, partial [Caldilineaceae bacterium]|nr:hypothetical protein [Caldilineaceae bacterium]
DYPADSITVLVVSAGAGNVTPTPTLTPTPTGTPVPVVENIIVPSIGSRLPVQYPLKVVQVFDPKLNLSVLKRTINFKICLYRGDVANESAPMRQPYIKALQYMADAIYEMSNGMHMVGDVTVYYSCDAMKTEVVWVDKAWPNATLNGYGNDVNAHVTMADTFAFPTPYAALA